MKTLIILFCIIISTATFSLVGQLDPHGKAITDYRKLKLSENGGCAVCHFEKGGKLGTFKDSGSRCTNCHGKMPHSGLAEHKRLACLSCHRPHRYAATKEEKTADVKSVSSSFIYTKRNPKKISGTVEKRSLMPMLSNSCSSCHSIVD
jgi:hypothetical protein